MIYYKFIPLWKDNSRKKWAYFVGDSSIVYSKFNTIEDGLFAAKLDSTCLREMNWLILECKFFGILQTRIMLETLYNKGYLSHVIDEDNISKCYNFK